MPFAKPCSIVVSAILVSVAGLSLAGCQILNSSADNTIALDLPVRLVSEQNDDIFLISLPDPQRDNPGRFSPEVIRIDESDRQLYPVIFRKTLDYSDSLTGELRQLNLLGFDSPNGRQWIGDPQYESPPLWPNPRDPSVLLFQPHAHLGSLYVLDTNRLEIRAIGDREALQSAIAKRRALPPSPPPPNCKESECEAQVSILYWAADPRWSPQGDRIAFTSNRDSLGRGDLMRIWLLEWPANRETRIAGTGDEAFRMVGWTANGRILAWKYSRQPDTLVAISPSSGEKEILLEGQFLEFLALSDDYKTLLYVNRPRRRDSGEVGLAKVYAFNLETGDRQLVFAETETERLAAPRPDFSETSDRLVLGIDDAGGQPSLFVYNLADRTGQRVHLPPGKRLLATERRLEWAGDRLVVPLEDRGDRRLSTLLIDLGDS